MVRYMIRVRILRLHETLLSASHTETEVGKSFCNNETLAPHESSAQADKESALGAGIKFCMAVCCEANQAVEAGGLRSVASKCYCCSFGRLAACWCDLR